MGELFLHLIPQEECQTQYLYKNHIRILWFLTLSLNAQIIDDIKKCSLINDPMKRLACFDALVKVSILLPFYHIPKRIFKEDVTPGPAPF